MLERRIKQEIRDFLDGDRKEALMVTGARQVGKTYIIRECASCLQIPRAVRIFCCGFPH